MTDPTTMDLTACDAELAAEFEELRGECRHRGTQGEPPACDCHRNGYVPAVTTGPLIEALWAHDSKIALSDPFGPEEGVDEWEVWLIPKASEACRGTADGFDLALRRAAVAAIREETA